MNKGVSDPNTPRGGLAARQVRLTLYIALLAGLLMAAIQILIDYNNEQKGLTRNLQQVLESTAPAATESIWMLDTALANGVTGGLISHPLIVEAGIKTSTNTVLSQQSDKTTTPKWSTRFNFLFGAPKTETIQLFHASNDTGSTIGILWLKIDPSMARQEFLGRVFVILISGLLKAFILAFVLLIVFHATLTRPIQRYARWIGLIDPDKPENWALDPPARTRQDELTAVGELASQRFQQARGNFLQLQQTRKELKQLNLVLEARVQDRTQDLETALKQAEYLATTDYLTGIPNRRNFMQRAKQRHAEWLRHGHPYSLLMLDLDYFKQVNDRYGHFAGDEVLKAVALVLQKTFRTEDIIGRIGGEEFCILLVGTANREAITLANRLCKDLAGKSVRVDQQLISITASLGLAWPENMSDDFDSILQSADRLLYEAKAAGRNQVCLAEKRL